jgi:hypothetical protein
MTRDEELLNEIIQRRGYLVVSSARQLSIGSPLGYRLRIRYPVTDQHRTLKTNAEWYVIAPTDQSDKREQTKLARQLSKEIIADTVDGPYFYRVLSD